MEILVRIPRVVTLSFWFAVRVVLTGDEILQCDRSDKSCWTVLCCGALYYDVQDTVDCIYPWTHALKTCFHVTSNFWVSGVKLWSFPAQENRVNHENTDSTDFTVGTSHLGGKTSKFDSWNSEVWRHVKTCFERARSRVDAIDGNTNFWVCESNPQVWPFKWSFWALFSCFSVYYAL